MDRSRLMKTWAGTGVALSIISIILTLHYASRKEKLTIVCMGDSLTVEGYPIFLQHIMTEKSIPALVIDKGVKGHTSGEYLHYLKRMNVLSETDPDIVLLQLGTNDIRIDADHTPTDRFIANLEQIITEINFYQQKKGKAVTVLIATIPPLKEVGHISTFNSESIRRVKEEINPAIEKIAKKWNLILVNNDNLFSGRMELLKDVHPTEEGYQQMAENWFKHIRTLFES